MISIKFDEDTKGTKNIMCSALVVVPNGPTDSFIFYVTNKHNPKRFKLHILWFPQSESAILRVCTDQILMWVVCHSYNVFFVNLTNITFKIKVIAYSFKVYGQGSLQFSGSGWKAVEHHILSHTVNPFTPRR